MSKRSIICACLVALIAILLALCLGGCGLGMSQYGQDVEIIYHEGGCLMIVDGLSVEQVKEKTKEWSFDTDCRIDVRTVTD